MMGSSTSSVTIRILRQRRSVRAFSHVAGYLGLNAMSGLGYTRTQAQLPSYGRKSPTSRHQGRFPVSPRGHVTDFGCRSCGWWSHGFVRAMVGLGGEMQGFSLWDVGGFGLGGERGLGASVCRWIWAGRCRDFVVWLPVRSVPCGR